MQSKILFHILLIFVVMLTLLDLAYSDMNKKHELGAKLGEKIKAAGLELFETDIQAMKQLCEKLLNEAKPTAEESVKLKKYIEDLEKLSKERDHMTMPELINAMKDVVTEKYLKYIRCDFEACKAYEADVTFVMEVIRDCVHKYEEAAKKFDVSVYNNWMELYKTISKKELERYQEYEHINNLMQGVERTKGRGAIFLDVIKSLIAFFEYKDWYNVLELDETKSNNSV